MTTKPPLSHQIFQLLFVCGLIYTLHGIIKDYYNQKYFYPTWYADMVTSKNLSVLCFMEAWDCYYPVLKPKFTTFGQPQNHYNWTKNNDIIIIEHYSSLGAWPSLSLMDRKQEVLT